MKYLGRKQFSAFVVLTVFGIVGFVVWQSVQSKSIESVVIENKTQSLIVESVEEAEKNDNQITILVSLKNNYKKAISAYRIRVSEKFKGTSDDSAVERGGLMIDWVLNPSETKIEKFIVNPEGKTYLTVAAVIFEDGTGDGEPLELAKLQDIRVGVLLGLQKVNEIYKDNSKKGNSFSSEESINDFQEKIEQLDDRDVPDNSKRGFALVKSYLKIELNDIKGGKAVDANFNPETEIMNKLSEIETLLIKFPTNLPSEKGGSKNEKN